MISLFLEPYEDFVSLISSYDAILDTMGFPSDVPSPNLPSVISSYSENSNSGFSLDEYKQQVINYDSALLNYYSEVVVSAVGLHNLKNYDLLKSLDIRNRNVAYYISDNKYVNETQDFIDNSNTSQLLVREYVLRGGLRASYHSYVGDNGWVWYQTDVTGSLFNVDTYLHKRLWRSCCLCFESCSIG